VFSTSHRVLVGAAVALGIVLGGFACSNLPPSLPSTDAHLRSASRIELVDLVIGDAVRAKKVRALYAQIEALMFDVKLTTSGEIMKLGADNPTRSDAETRAVVAKVRQAEIAAFQRYVKLQMELRRSMTADEFAKLDAIK
jgi:hypothetical protein